MDAKRGHGDRITGTQRGTRHRDAPGRIARTGHRSRQISSQTHDRISHRVSSSNRHVEQVTVEVDVEAVGLEEDLEGSVEETVDEEEAAEEAVMAEIEAVEEGEARSKRLPALRPPPPHQSSDGAHWRVAGQSWP